MQRDIDRTDLMLEDLLSEVFSKEYEPEKIKAGAAIGKGDKLSLYKLRGDNAKNAWERFKSCVPGYLPATELSAYHRDKVRRKPELYKAIQYNRMWFIPQEVAFNVPQEKRGPKCKLKK